MKAKTCILVLGMHRSGTSALTRVLNMLGAQLPKTPLLSMEGNETGHWESQKIVDFNDAFLLKHGSTWHDWTSFDAESLSRTQRKEFIEDMGALLRSEYQDAGLIAIKDPRICRFADLFAQAVEQAGYTVKCIQMMRNPLEVNASLIRRNHISPVHANLLWLRHVLDGEYLSRGYARSFITFDGLLADYKTCLAKIASDLNLEWPYIPESIARDAETFLTPGDKHHIRSTEEVLLNPDLGPWVVDAYMILRRAETVALSKKDMRALDKIRENFDVAAPMLQSVSANLKSQMTLVSDQLENARNEVIELTEGLVQRDKELANALWVVEVSSGKYAHEKKIKKRLEKMLDERCSKIWELEQKLKTQMEYSVHKQKHMDALLNSSSWKMTAFPRKIIRIWRRKLPFLIGLLAGKSARAQFKNIDQIGETAEIARSKATVAARHDLAQTREQVFETDWYQAVSGNKIIADKDLPNITISAVTYNSEKWMKGFFASVKALDYPHRKISIHFVDNGSSDGTVRVIEAFIKKGAAKFGELQLFQRPNEGYGAGNDYGIRRSKDEFVLVTNVDVEFYADSLKAAVNVAVHDDAKTACWEFRQTPYEHPKYYDPITRLTNWNSHACVLIRKKAYLEVGGYEKRIFMYGEDVELSYRFRACGWNLRYVADAVIKHYVDLNDLTVRPNQLSGSAAANILLRYRYGSYVDILAGEAFLFAVKRHEVDPVRRQAWEEATRIVKANRLYFFRKRKFTGTVHFPFHEFDYDIVRPGADVVHIPFKPEEKKDLPLISVITRTHGDALHHLHNAVASVLAQTYKNIELIVVEDRTDAAKAYVEGLQAQYGDKIRYFKSADEGRSACGNFGAAQAKGEYLCWLDNDDMFFADHIETLVRALENDPEAVCSYALAWDALSKMDGNKPVELSYQLPEMHCQPYDKQRLLNENFIPIQSIIFSKTLFDTYGGFNVEFSQLEDWNLWVRYAQGGVFTYTPKVTSMYRTPHNESEREARHSVLNDAYEAVRQTNLEDVAKLSKKKKRRKAPGKPTRKTTRKTARKKVP